jgi:hypothetical protein
LAALGEGSSLTDACCPRVGRNQNWHRAAPKGSLASDVDQKLLDGPYAAKNATMREPNSRAGFQPPMVSRAAH